MSHVNILPEFNHQKPFVIEAICKQYPYDFEVREISSTGSVSTLTENREYEAVPWEALKVEGKTAVVSSANDIQVPRLARKDLIDDDKWSLIHNLNRWIDTYSCDSKATMAAVEVLLQSSSDKRERELIHNYVKNEFLFVCTDSHSSGCTELKSSLSLLSTSPAAGAAFPPPPLNSFNIVVRPDLSLAELFPWLDLEDIKQLYMFKNRGPFHVHADKGIQIGRHLGKEARTKVYQVLTAKCRSLDSKTVDRNNHKCMLVFWRAKARQGKRRCTEDKQLSITPRTCHMHFTLFKADTEQVVALSNIAHALHMSPSDVCYAGIKDRRALTYQSCSVIIRPPPLPTVNTSYSANTNNYKKQCRRSENYEDENRKPVSDTSEGMDSSSPEDYAVQYNQMIRDSAKKLLIMSQHWDWQAAMNSVQTLSLNNTTETTDSLAPRGIAVGNISLSDKAMSIGDLWGNRFNITLRDTRLRSPPHANTLDNHHNHNVLDLVREALAACTHTTGRGFVNYFGSQRMGYTFGDVTEMKQDVCNRLALSKTSNMTITYAALNGDNDVNKLVVDSLSDGGLGAGSGSGGMGDGGNGSSNDDGSINVVGGLVHAVCQRGAYVVPSSVLPAGPAIGKLILQRRFEEAVYRILLGDGCCQPVSKCVEVLDMTTSKSSVTPLKAAIFTSLQLGDVLGSNFICCSNPLCGARMALLTGAPFSDVLNKLPHHSTRERMVVRGLVRFGPDAFQRAFEQIPFNTRLLWVHSYQSWIWNGVASYRISSYGYRTIEGDIVYIGDGYTGNDSKLATHSDEQTPGIAEDQVHKLEKRNADVSGRQVSEKSDKKVQFQYVTREQLSGMSELECNELTSRVMLPMFGSNVIYPANDVGRFYNDYLVTEGFPSALSVAPQASINIPDATEKGGEGLDALSTAVCGLIGDSDADGANTDAYVNVNVDIAADVISDTTDADFTVDTGETEPIAEMGDAQFESIREEFMEHGKNGSARDVNTTEQIEMKATSSPPESKADLDEKCAENMRATIPKGSYRRLLQYAYDASAECFGGPLKSVIEEDRLQDRADVADNADMSNSNPTDETVIRLKFSLRAGAYATALLREITNNDLLI